ncbi:MAG: aspartate-semialdehyde dehydrogenase [Spirochaetia bacterium]|nr:aspartate-semialdehyde dehydrogenase [Spirochaetia bacterium]
MAKTYTVAVVGACGVVGTEMISTLERRKFPVGTFVPLDIASQVGKELTFNGKKWAVKEAKEGAFKGVDIAIFSAGGDASAVLAPIAVKEGAIVVDNSSQWRMDPNCPLVVPEVNPQDLDWHKGIIANPNCSTTQMVVVLKPIHDVATIKRVVVSTYQAVSGSGKRGIDGLLKEATEYLETGKVATPLIYKQQTAFNAIPHIDVFQEKGYTKEEYKMVYETQKMVDKNIVVSPTCVRIPVWYGHSESINIETEKKLTAQQVRDILSKAPSIKVIDDVANEIYPTPIMSNDEDLTMVGRIREDVSLENGINLWCVSNNIRKGAALNAVQIAETLLERKLV